MSRNFSGHRMQHLCPESQNREGPAQYSEKEPFQKKLVALTTNCLGKLGMGWAV